MSGRTIWVLGDQLNRGMGALRDAAPTDARILLVESEAKVASKRWHRQRLHVVLSAMRHFAAELAADGFAVDLRRAPTLRAGLDAHRAEYQPSDVVAMEPASWDGRAMLERAGVTVIRSDQFLCHPDEFDRWAGTKTSLRMEDFYRWQRRRLDLLMDGDEPAGGRWNFDDQNREPPPTGAHDWPDPPVSQLDEIDRAVAAEIDELPNVWGAPPTGVWPTTRRRARARLRHVVDEVLPVFGPHEDAMLTTSWHLAHTLLSAPLNIGLLTPHEVADAIDDAYRSGGIPIASAEGLMRQVIGWREFVWGVYWRWMPEYRDVNDLGADRPLPPAFTGTATEMRCVEHTMRDLYDYGWTHHIQRLMVLGNLSLLHGVRPDELVEWMWAGFVDGAEWVMLPNVLGMALHADGGRMASKPYAAGGAYIDRMSDYCRECRFDRKQRTGDDACPFTTLYWDFLARHETRFERHPRMAQSVRAMRKLSDLDAVRGRAVEVRRRLDAGQL